MEAARREIKEYCDELVECSKMCEKYFDPSNPDHPLKNMRNMTREDKNIIGKYQNLLDRMMSMETLREAAGIKDDDPIFDELGGVSMRAKELLSTMFVLPKLPETIEEKREFVKKLKVGELGLRKK